MDEVTHKYLSVLMQTMWYILQEGMAQFTKYESMLKLLEKLECLGIVQWLKYSNLKQSQKRYYLLLHEYVTMGLLEDFGICVPKFKLATTPEQVQQIAASKEFGNDLVIKAQVY
ncbi:unnamed protein product [Didymodactylos carnosus]|uniref:Uncharacterized protein n=1 Tax=Didymodactylos carnosus TaxID=1234261 RepID=A0A8S2CL97_9BILA|nr:unnamed protein product [Didymodactylos carnosus]CAF3511026.1 unnamed protein product [Didymodactylos carnosus]